MAGCKSKPLSSAGAVDEQLQKYRSMRDFAVTAEPAGRPGEKLPEVELPFVIQKHAATRLHYDFRLGWRGVLKSWAVAKGPSYFTGDKRLAVQVEDHPIEYGGFEGIIPKGQYGGGTVMLWDQGTWEPQGDADEMLAKGNLKFILHGAKLQGKWALIRMGGKAAQESKPNWLLIKEHDEFERSNSDPSVTEEKPDSVVTGRGLDEIAAQEDHVWNSNKTDKTKSVLAEPKSSTLATKPAPGAKADQKPQSASIPAEIQSFIETAPKEALPEFISPQLATQATLPPEGGDWIHELKLDGYRIQARLQENVKQGRLEVTLLTRNGLNWSDRMPEVASEFSHLNVQSAILDGEVVVLNASGGTSFADLQASFREGKKNPLTYFVFDLLHLNGRNLRQIPLSGRKMILDRLLADLPENDVVRLSEHLSTSGKAIFENACRLGAEGIISKRGSGQYTSGRSTGWLKIKCINEQEFVIGGFTPGAKGNTGIGALLLGDYEADKFIYAGRTGTGFTQATHKALQKKLDALHVKNCPFEEIPAAAKRGTSSSRPQWVEPKLVAQIRFATWTADNLLRQASFKGLREDKAAKEVTRDRAIAAAGAEQSTEDPESIEEPSEARPQTHKTASERRSSRGTGQVSAEPAPVRLTHPDKVIDVESGLTKRALADYYWAIARQMLPYIAHRPLSIVRCPDGSIKPCFFQKHVAVGLPAGVQGVEIKDRKGGPPESYITLSSAETLAALAQLGVLEVHPWGSRSETLETPDQLIFDLDPDTSISWQTLAESALDVQSRLRALGLRSFVKTTGGKGLHIIAPIKPELDWTVVKEFAHAFADRMATSNPRLFLTKMTKAARVGKIYIDYLRNERGATAVAPYSPRARAGMCVAAPLDWKELGGSSLPRFPAADFSSWRDRLRQDPWKDMLSTIQGLGRGALESYGLAK